MKMGKIEATSGARQKNEILDALKKLGEPLTNDEEQYLKNHVVGGSNNFAKMSNFTGKLHCARKSIFTEISSVQMLM
jgi:hypothetical protein